MSHKDFYKILQVDPAAETEVIAAAYKRLAQKYHPDINPSPDATRRMQEINAAYEVLSHPDRRSLYDRERLARSTPLDGARCPRDGAILGAIAVFEGQVHRCAECQGLWITKAGLQTLSKSLRLDVPELFGGAAWPVASLPDSRLTCPDDAAALAATHWREVEIDICPKCFGIWFDRDELDKLAGRRPLEDQARPERRQRLIDGSFEPIEGVMEVLVSAAEFIFGALDDMID